jgi:hypothetical protein
MPAFADWLVRLLESGESVQAEPPVISPHREVTELLRSAFRLHSFDVGGPAIAFDPETAFQAVATLAEACWRLVSPEPDGPMPRDRLGVPRSPSAHLSADVTLRFLPAVYRRSKPRGDDDPLAKWTADVLRAWPLSGVLANLPAGPASIDFGWHAGLALLYAERLVENPTAAWVPTDGANREQVERVFQQRGKPVPLVPISESAT